MGLKVISMKEWLISHILLIAGLVLITIGLLEGRMVLNVIGMWAFTLGLCLGFSFAFRKLAAK
jgi:uncharacterized membrane protein YiaA